MKHIIFLSFVFLALITQTILIKQGEITDWTMWTDQLQYMNTRDARVFNMLGAYAYPGTPPLLLALATVKIFGVSYDAALTGSLALIHALAAGWIGVLCYTLRRNYWWLAATGAIFFNRVFALSTPPTLVVILPIVALAIYTWWLLEKATLCRRELVWWALAAGAICATRIDIGGAVVAALGLLLAYKIGWKSFLAVTIGALATFCLLNPFMWFMPLQHVVDIWQKITYHYSEYAYRPLPLLGLLFISPLAVISICVALLRLALHKTAPFPLPKTFFWCLLIVTGAITAIVLNSQLQTPRYFYPLTTLWEVLLPIFLLDLPPYFRFDFASTRAAQKLRELCEAAIIVILVGGQLIIFLHLLLLPQITFACEQPGTWHPRLCDRTIVILW